MMVEATVTVTGTVWVALSLPDEWKPGDRIDDDQVRRALEAPSRWEDHLLDSVTVSFGDQP